MSEDVSAKSAIQMASGGLVLIGLIFSMVGIEDLGSGCCGLGICGLILGGIVSAAGGAASTGQGNMVLKQDSSGEWKWVGNDLHGTAQQTQGRAAQYNDQSNQIMSRVVSEVRGGKKLEDLETSELDIIASAYGIDSGSKTQKIEALHKSDLAKKGLQLGALVTVGGLGAVGASKIVKKGRERAIERAEELREEGREKLRQNVEEGKYKINEKMPKNAQGETATEVAGNIVMDQLSKQIHERKLTPEILIELGDFNKDGKLDPVEIAGALSAATGMAIPVFIIKDSIKEFDTNGDGSLDTAELYRLWNYLGIEIEEEPMEEESIEEEPMEEESIEDELSEIDSVMDEIDDEIVIEEVADEGSNASNVELTDGIDTEFEQLIIEMEGARFSSERRELMNKQESEYLVNLRIKSMERTLLGDPDYRGGQSVHGLIDGGPYVGVIKVPVSFDEQILSMREGDDVKMWVKLVDFSPSLKRPVLEASEII